MLFFVFGGTPAALQSQFIAHPNPPVVQVGNDTLLDAWGGGLWAPHFSMVDVDLDGQKDLVAFDRASQSFVCWKWTNGRWAAQPNWPYYMPRVTGFALFRDYNGDGRNDLFAGAFGGGVQAFQNTSSSMMFQLIKSYDQLPTVMYSSSPTTIYVPGSDIPAIEDIDGDGDLDFLSFYLLGTTIHMHRNLAVEQNLPLDSLHFDLDDQCWGKFQESSSTNALILHQSCPPVMLEDEFPQPEHSGSTITLFDKDNDGDFDLLLGDVSFNNIVYARNGKQEYNHPVDSMIMWQSAFPLNHPMMVNIFPVASVVDADNDQRLDIVVNPSVPFLSDNYAQIRVYKNVASNGFSLQFSDSFWIQREMIDVGGYASPAFMDVDGDGDQDLLISGETRRDGMITYRIEAYANDGGSPPVFTRISTNFAGLADTAYGPWRIEVADIDGDGDEDLFIASSDGRIRWFRNEAGMNQAVQFSLAQDTFGGWVFGGTPTLDLVDINLDGKLDLLVMSSIYGFYYFKNIGTTTNPVFQLQTDTFGGYALSQMNPKSFAVTDINGDGFEDMLLSFDFHPLMVAYNFRSHISQFSLDTVLHSLTQQPLFEGGADLESTTLFGDSLPAVVMGLSRGGLLCFKNTNAPVGIPAKPRSQVVIFPNPVRGNRTITLQTDRPMVAVHLYAPDGRRIFCRQLLGTKAVLELPEHLPQGIYGVQVVFPDQWAMRQLMIW